MKLETQMKLAANMKRLRLSCGYSQAELARRLQINRSVLAQCESGQRCPSLDTLYELSRLYGLTMESMLETDPVCIVDAAAHGKMCENEEHELLLLFRKLSSFSKGRLLEKAEDLAAWDAAFRNARSGLKQPLR